MALRLPLAFVLLLVLAPASIGAEEAFRFREEKLPRGWTVKQTIRVPDAQLPAFGARLGAPVIALENQVLDVGGLAARWNTITAQDEEGAQTIEGAMVGMRGDAFVRRVGRHVHEVAGDNVLLARAVFAAAGLEEAEAAVYDVAFRTALVDELDYRKVNALFNDFLAFETGALDEATARARVEEGTSGWRFGNTLRLRAPDEPWLRVAWAFEPKPSEAKREGDVLVYRFDDPPTRWGIPYVDVTGRIEVRSRFTPTGRRAEALSVVDTEHWPTAPVATLAVSAARRAKPGLDRARALLLALHERVGYGGAVGSRDPVAQVLARGHGRCWDKSDVYVAMCRAAGVPARQVAGWVPALGAGHVWTEVHAGSDGWLPVDATTPWLGTGTDYVPFFLSEDGRMPFLYLRMPQVSRREGP